MPTCARHLLLLFRLLLFRPEAVGSEAALASDGALAGPVTSFLYDWNMLPIGQALWLKELESYKQFPPLQSPESWNLDQVTVQIRNGMSHPAQ